MPHPGGMESVEDIVGKQGRTTEVYPGRAGEKRQKGQDREPEEDLKAAGLANAWNRN